MPISATVSLARSFPEVTTEILGRLVNGQNKASEHLLGLAKDEAPMDVGTLEGSGSVVPAEKAGEDALVVFDTPYAARLHEHPEYDFSKDSNPKAKGKYLEDPAQENKSLLGQIIATEGKA